MVVLSPSNLSIYNYDPREMKEYVITGGVLQIRVFCVCALLYMLYFLLLGMHMYWLKIVWVGKL